MPAQKKNNINLSPQKEFETTTTGRILAWILSTFRIIVMVTEIIVMIAFLSRFWLDAQNSNLSDEIEEKKVLLTTSLSFENEFRDTQQRANILSQIWREKKSLISPIKTIVSYLPEDLSLTSISFNKDLFTIEGVTPNEQSIQQFYVNLKESKIFENINITEINSDFTNPELLVFSLKAEFGNKTENSEVPDLYVDSKKDSTLQEEPR